jgi:hypothetical protein
MVTITTKGSSGKKEYMRFCKHCRKICKVYSRFGKVCEECLGHRYDWHKTYNRKFLGFKDCTEKGVKK